MPAGVAAVPDLMSEALQEEPVGVVPVVPRALITAPMQPGMVRVVAAAHRTNQAAVLQPAGAAAMGSS